MWPDNDNWPPADYFDPKPSPWRWFWLALVFSVPVAFGLTLVRLALWEG